MRHRKVSVLVLIAGLAGCSWFDDYPYGDFSIGKVDETGPEREAAIVVGDPQVIAPVTLINDRRSAS